eukprot:353217-Chlamydomonas_euryale.AAC.1
MPPTLRNLRPPPTPTRSHMESVWRRCTGGVAVRPPHFWSCETARATCLVATAPTAGASPRATTGAGRRSSSRWGLRRGWCGRHVPTHSRCGYVWLLPPAHVAPLLPYHHHCPVPSSTQPPFPHLFQPHPPHSCCAKINALPPHQPCSPMPHTMQLNALPPHQPCTPMPHTTQLKPCHAEKHRYLDFQSH